MTLFPKEIWQTILSYLEKLTEEQLVYQALTRWYFINAGRTLSVIQRHWAQNEKRIYHLKSFVHFKHTHFPTDSQEACNEVEEWWFIRHGFQRNQKKTMWEIKKGRNVLIQINMGLLEFLHDRAIWIDRRNHKRIAKRLTMNPRPKPKLWQNWTFETQRRYLSRSACNPTDQRLQYRKRKR